MLKLWVKYSGEREKETIKCITHTTQDFLHFIRQPRVNAAVMVFPDIPASIFCSPFPYLGISEKGLKKGKYLSFPTNERKYYQTHNHAGLFLYYLLYEKQWEAFGINRTRAGFKE